MADLVKGEIADDASWMTDLCLDSVDWAELMMELGDKYKQQPEMLSDRILAQAQITKALTPRTIAQAIDEL